MARHIFVFPIAAETGHAGDDDLGVDGEEHVGAEPEFLEDAGPEGINYYICVGNQGLYKRGSGGGFEVHGDWGFVSGEEITRWQWELGGARGVGQVGDRAVDS